MNILIIEDDSFLASKIKEAFEKHVITNQIKVVDSYLGFLNELGNIKAYDIVLTDLKLSPNKKEGGMEIINVIRNQRINIPIVVISSCGELSCLNKAFDLGANDYLIKPFRIQELHIRVLKWFKIYYISLNLTNENKIRYQELLYDLDVNEFFYNGEKIPLSKRSKYILSLFLSHPEKLFTERALIEKIWLDRDDTVNRNLRIVILRLKKSLAEFGIDHWIENIRGEGYIFAKK